MRDPLPPIEPGPRPRPEPQAQPPAGARALRSVDPRPRGPDVHGLLDAVDDLVTAELTRARRALTTRRIERLLAEVHRAQLILSPDADPHQSRQLAAATGALQSTLDHWHGQRSHALEWIIIGLITLDIVVHLG